VSVEKFRDGRHPTDFTKRPGEALVGLRSTTSLDLLPLLWPPEHVAELYGLPPIHHDPFDRAMIAQAITVRRGLVSKTSPSKLSANTQNKRFRPWPRTVSKTLQLLGSEHPGCPGYPDNAGGQYFAESESRQPMTEQGPSPAHSRNFLLNGGSFSDVRFSLWSSSISPSVIEWQTNQTDQKPQTARPRSPSRNLQ
jgi:hypothetical protein